MPMSTPKALPKSISGGELSNAWCRETKATYLHKAVIQLVFYKYLNTHSQAYTKNDMTWKNGTFLNLQTPPKIFQPKPMGSLKSPPVQSQFWKPRGDIVEGCWTPKWWNFVVSVVASVKKNNTKLATFSSWWLNHPSPKICSSKWESSPNRGKNEKYLKPPPQFLIESQDAPQLLQLWHETFRTWSFFLKWGFFFLNSLLVIFQAPAVESVQVFIFNSTANVLACL